MKPIHGSAELASQRSSLSKVLVLLGSTPNLDTIAAGLGIALSLRKAGHDVQIASEAEMRVEFSRLVGVDEVKKRIANRNLVVSFAYSEDRVEKVSYNISDDGRRFNLVIAPKTGSVPLDPSSVQFDMAGVEADLVIMVGVNNYQELGAFYEQERNAIEGAQTVALTLFPVPTYAKMHADAQGLSGMSELAVAFLESLHVAIEADAASNLLYGIESATMGLTAASTGADTFESVAILLRAGGKRQPLASHQGLSQNHMPFSLTQPQPVVQPVAAGATNPFAAALGGTQQAMPVQQPVPSEMKG